MASLLLNLEGVLTALLAWFAESGAPFLMEVTRRTAADKKGGHLALRPRDGRLILRESAQCPDADAEAFQDIGRHRFFNTNNLWIRLDHLKDTLTKHGGLIPLPMIRNSKTADPRDKNSPAVYQLETAMGAAIESFAGARAISVGRERFAPVKTTSDLLITIGEPTGDPDAIRESAGYLTYCNKRYSLLRLAPELVVAMMPP